MKKTLIALLLLSSMLLATSCGKPQETTREETTAERKTETTAEITKPAETTVETIVSETTAETTAETTLPEIVVDTTLVYQVNLNNNTAKEKVIVDPAAVDKPNAKAIVVQDAGGKTLCEFEYSSSSQPGGWALGTETNGASWLLEWHAYEEPVKEDSARRRLVISINRFNVTDEGEINRLENSTTTFDTGKQALYEKSSADIAATEQKLAALLQKSVLLFDNSGKYLVTAQKDAPAASSYHYEYTPYEPAGDLSATALLALIQTRMSALKGAKVTRDYNVRLSGAMTGELSGSVVSRTEGIGSDVFAFAYNTNGFGASDISATFLGSSYFWSSADTKIHYVLIGSQPSSMVSELSPSPNYYSVSDFTAALVTRVGEQYRLTYKEPTNASYQDLLGQFAVEQYTTAASVADFTINDWMSVSVLSALPDPSDVSYYLLVNNDGFVTEECVGLTYSLTVNEQIVNVTYTLTEKTEDIETASTIKAPVDSAAYLYSVLPYTNGEYPGLLISNTVLTSENQVGNLVLFVSDSNKISAMIHDPAAFDYLSDQWTVPLDEFSCGGIYYTFMNNEPGIFNYYIQRASSVSADSKLTYSFTTFETDAATGRLKEKNSIQNTLSLTGDANWNTNNTILQTFLLEIQPYLTAGTLLVDSSSGEFLTYDSENPVTLSTVDPSWIYTDIIYQIPFGYRLVNKVVFVVNAETLNVRSTPTVPEAGQPDNRIGWLNVGESAFCVAVGSDGWCLVDYKSTQGYVSSKYLVVCPEDYTPCFEHVTLTNDTSSLFIRSTPEIPEETEEDNKIGFISETSDVIRIAKGSDGWSLIILDGEPGFASSKYLKVVEQ